MQVGRSARSRPRRPWLAGKHLEAAGYALKDAGTGTADEVGSLERWQLGQPYACAPQVGALFRRASVCYIEADRAQTAADALSHGGARRSGSAAHQRPLLSLAPQRARFCAGKALEPLDGSLAVELYLEACGVYEEEGKEVFAMDIYRAAAAAMVRQEKFHEAITVLLRHAGVRARAHVPPPPRGAGLTRVTRRRPLLQSCDRVQSYASLTRCYLSAIVVYLTLGEVAQAQEGYYDYMEVEQFERSEEARAAWELLDCYQQADLPRLKKVTAGGVFSSLEQCFIKLAKKLPVGDFGKQAAALNASRGGGPSEDAAALDDGDLT